MTRQLPLSRKIPAHAASGLLNQLSSILLRSCYAPARDRCVQTLRILFDHTPRAEARHNGLDRLFHNLQIGRAHV